MSLGAHAHRLLQVRQVIGWRGDAFRQVKDERRGDVLEAGITDMQAHADRARRIQRDDQAAELLADAERMTGALIELQMALVAMLTAIEAAYAVMLDRIAEVLADASNVAPGEIRTDPDPPPRLPDVVSLIAAPRPGPLPWVAPAAA